MRAVRSSGMERARAWDGATRARGRARGRRATRAMNASRPYTVRQGDTLNTIASKRKMEVRELLRYNLKLKEGDDVKAGMTILLPAEKLSARDRAIIDGIGKVNEPRTYPTRAGETIDDILTSRKIARGEVEKLNPGVKLAALKAGTKLKLPDRKSVV